MKIAKVKPIHVYLKGRNIKKAIFYWNAKVTCCRCFSLQEKKGGLYNTYHELLSEKRTRDPDFMRCILYHPNQQHYSQHPILWVLLNISTIVLRARLITALSQHPIKQVGLTILLKTSLIRKSDNIKYRTQKPFTENQSLKFTDLRQTQRFIEGLSNSTALVHYSLSLSQIHWYYNSNIIPKLYRTYRNHAAIPRKKIHTQNKQQQNKQKQQQHIVVPVYITGGDAIRQWL